MLCVEESGFIVVLVRGVFRVFFFFKVTFEFLGLFERSCSKY